jgi:transposase
VPGRKTDQKDCEWIADLLQHGLLRGSFVPPKPLRELRDLTRYRVSLAQECNRIANRIQKVLEDANLKLASVASDPLGASGRAILKAILAGEEDTERLAEMSRGILRNKIPELRLALEGRVTEHHRFLLKQLLEHQEFMERKMGEVEAEIERRMRPFEAEVERLDTIPGVDRVTAWSLIAEVGVKMEQFPSAAHLASWAGLCPGSFESAGKRLSGKTRKGSASLRRCLCQVGSVVAHMRDKLSICAVPAASGATRRQASGLGRGAHGVGDGVSHVEATTGLPGTRSGLFRPLECRCPTPIAGASLGEAGPQSHFGTRPPASVIGIFE